MARREEQRDRIDPNLDAPSEANTQKHINFLEEEEKSSSNNRQDKDEFSEDRKKEWQEGLAEGKERRDRE